MTPFTISNASGLPREPGPSDSAGWLHVSCAVFTDTNGVPRFPWQRISAALEQWRAEQRFRRCFFVRKAPGLRLRFCGDNLADSLEPELVTWLHSAERTNQIRGFRFGVYEPETARFGGSAGMAIAHEHFDRDSRIAAEYEMFSESERVGLRREMLSTFLINDLFARSLDDSAEIWDVWQKVSRIAGISLQGSESTRVECALARDVATRNARFTSGLSPRVNDLLDRASADNAYVAQRLRAIVSSGRLHIGIRSWLATAAVFHWNRLGLTNIEIGSMISTMTTLLNPHEHESWNHD